MYTPAPKTRITAGILLLCLAALPAAAAPQAAFTASQTLGCAPLTVRFTNQSVAATSYFWDLGNGNTSTLQDPVNIYTVAGTYTVTLVAIDGSGLSDTITRYQYISVSPNPVADFTASQQAACLDGNQVSFINTSTPGLTYLWDFGDGTISTLANPSHTYPQAGIFSVSLVATNALGCSETRTRTNFIQIFTPPSAIVQSNATYACDSTRVFQFNNASTSGSRQWDFGDGNSSSAQAPSHQYAGPGIYPVVLTVTDGNGCSATDTLEIQVLTAHFADFTVDQDTGCVPMNVKFTPAVSGGTYFWNLGNGTTTNYTGPNYVYHVPGVYDITLIVTQANGCSDTLIRPGLIAVGSEPQVNFTATGSNGCSPFAVSFTNLSPAVATASWNFGDGAISTLQHPVHTYTHAGNYNVTLTCTNMYGCSADTTKSNFINVSAPTSGFSTSVRSGCPPLSVPFTNSSLGDGLTYHWSFGDGQASVLATPVHNYTSTGAFTVTLIVRDSSGCTDTLVKPAFIQVADPLMGYIPPPVTVGCAPYTASFTDATSGATSWLWNFGDGATSSLQNPVHTYTTAGMHIVSLTTQSAGGGCAGNIPNFSTFDIQGGYAAFTDSFDQCPPYDISFFDSSDGANSWFWQFGDGTTSTLQNPTHTYALPGYHSVSLVVTTPAGCTFSTMKSNGIYYAPFGSNFYSVPMSSTFPMTVNFYANSIGANAWLWDFGDSTFSTLENPSHLYTDSGDFNITLTISNGLCSLFYDPPPLVFSPPDSSQMQPPAAGLPPVPQYGCAPFNVSFAYNVRDAIDWVWYFGDGDSSASQFPIHTYTTPGNYSVNLLTIDSFGVATTFRFDTIVHVNGPHANFSLSQAPNCQNTEVLLTNNSTSALHYLWEFGDGATDTIADPVHVYTSGLPNYIISLRATDDFGCQSILSSSLFVNAGTPVLVSETDVCGGDTVHFSSGLTQYQQYAWDFGDGSTDTVASPWHVYAQAGVFLPTLSVTDAHGCIRTETSPYPITVNAPHAGFSTPDLHGCDQLDAGFINTSTGADAFAWNFGDGTVSSNYQPFHTYSQAGIYSVILTAYKSGCMDSLVMPDYLKVDTAHAEYTYTLGEVCLPYTVAFTDQSVNAVAWSWYFGENTTDTVQHPVHTYLVQPTTGARLTIVDNNGCKDEYWPPAFSGPRLEIEADRTIGCLPLSIAFTGTVSVASNFYWDFGDGDTSSTLNPSHTYTSPGIYRVMLIGTALAQFGLCTDTLFFEDTIRVIDPQADFSTPDLAACAPSLVNFVNQSTDGDTYLWTFGDGSSSNSVSPSHLYKQPGLYTVSLVATSVLGCSDTLVRNQYVRVLGPVTNFTLSDTTGCIPLEVICTDSSRDAVTWLWSFGDGYSSTSRFPVHTYTDSGVYSVALITTDTVGCSSFLEYPYKVHANPNPVAGFFINDTEGCGSLTATLSNLSSGFSSIWWNFGDGGYSISANPVHTWSQPGSYDVSLIAYNRYGCTDTLLAPAPVTVYTQPVAAFTPSATQGCPPLAVNFNNLSATDTGAVFTWNFGNGQVSNMPDPSAAYGFPGLYSVSLTIVNPSGCSDSVSMASLIHVFDTLPPPVSEIASVSVASDSAVEITWQNNAAIDLGAYVLYRLNTMTGAFEVIYTDTNPANTSFALTSTYTDSGLNTLRNIYTYKLQTLDFCSNTMPLEALRAHSTVNVEASLTGFNIRVSWNPYGGCPVSTYEVYRASSTSAFQRIAILPGDSLALTDSAFICPDNYVYRVRAMDLCGNPYNSWSDTTAARPNHVFNDQKVEMVRSTVVDNSYVLTEWLPPVVRPLSVVSYELYRSTDNVSFTLLASLPPQQTDYADYDVKVSESRYYYKIRIRNNCDIEEGLGDNTVSILLRGEKTEDRIVHLQWTPYDSWIDGVDHYTIERLDDFGNWQYVKQVNGTTTSTEFRDE